MTFHLRFAARRIRIETDKFQSRKELAAAVRARRVVRVLVQPHGCKAYWSFVNLALVEEIL